MAIRKLSKGNPKALITARKRLSLSQDEFAGLLGVASNTVARWERGDLRPPLVAELAARYLVITSERQKSV